MAQASYKQVMPDFGKYEDIKVFLHDRFNMRVTVDDLKNANPDAVVMIYLKFLQAFNFRTDNLNQIPFGSRIAESELHQDIMPYALLVQMITKFLRTMGSNISFSLGDVIQPRPKKFKMLLAQLCQFYMFWEDKMKLYEPIREECDKKKAMEESLSKNNEELKIKINQLQCGVNEIGERIGSMGDYQVNLIEMNNKKEGFYKRERDQVKRKEEDLNNRLKNVKQERSMLPDVIQQLQQQVKPTVHEVNQHIKATEQEVAEWEEKCNALVQKKLVLADSLKAEQVRCKLEERVQASKEVYAHGMQYLGCREKVLVTQKNTENIKTDILGMEKNLEQKQEMLAMLKSQNEKELWRRQCQLEEINGKYHKKEEKVLETKDEGSLRNLYEREVILQKTIKGLEEKGETMDKSFLSAVKHLMDYMKRDHEEEKKAVTSLVKNLKK